MNGRSRFRVIPEETQQAGVPLSSRFGFILIQLSSGRNPTTHPGKPNQLTAFQCTGKQGIEGPTMPDWTSRREREVQSACWWQRPQTSLNAQFIVRLRVPAERFLSGLRPSGTVEKSAFPLPAVRFLFLLLGLIAHELLHVGPDGQQLLHILPRLAEIGVSRLFLRQQRGIFSL